MLSRLKRLPQHCLFSISLEAHQLFKAVHLLVLSFVRYFRLNTFLINVQLRLKCIISYYNFHLFRC